MLSFYTLSLWYNHHRLLSSIILMVQVCNFLGIISEHWFWLNHYTSSSNGGCWCSYYFSWMNMVSLLLRWWCVWFLLCDDMNGYKTMWFWQLYHDDHHRHHCYFLHVLIIIIKHPVITIWIWMKYNKWNLDTYICIYVCVCKLYNLCRYSFFSFYATFLLIHKIYMLILFFSI